MLRFQHCHYNNDKNVMFNQMRIQYVDFTEQQRSPPPNYRI